jgi:NifB/MoaA-like Fe-S oxidoreductase
MTKKKLAELRERMMNHSTVSARIATLKGVADADIAVVVVTANELDDLIRMAERLMSLEK